MQQRIGRTQSCEGNILKTRMGVGEQIAKGPEDGTLQGLTFRPDSCRRNSNLRVTEDNFDNIRPIRPGDNSTDRG